MRESQRRWPRNGANQDVERVSVEEMLAERKALLARLEAEEPYPGLDRFKREVQCGIERLTRRIERTEATK